MANTVQQLENEGIRVLNGGGGGSLFVHWQALSSLIVQFLIIIFIASLFKNTMFMNMLTCTCVLINTSTYPLVL